MSQLPAGRVSEYDPAASVVGDGSPAETGTPAGGVPEPGAGEGPPGAGVGDGAGDLPVRARREGRKPVRGAHAGGCVIARCAGAQIGRVTRAVATAVRVVDPGARSLIGVGIGIRTRGGRAGV